MESSSSSRVGSLTVAVRIAVHGIFFFSGGFPYGCSKDCSTWKESSSSSRVGSLTVAVRIAVHGIFFFFSGGFPYGCSKDCSTWNLLLLLGWDSLGLQYMESFSSSSVE